MDGQRFDRIARALAGGSDRRRLLRGLGAGAAGAALAALGRAARPTAAVECGGLGEPCCPAILAVGGGRCDEGLVCSTELRDGDLELALVGSSGRCVPDEAIRRGPPIK